MGRMSLSANLCSTHPSPSRTRAVYCACLATCLFIARIFDPLPIIQLSRIATDWHGCGSNGLTLMKPRPLLAHLMANHEGVESDWVSLWVPHPLLPRVAWRPSPNPIISIVFVFVCFFLLSDNILSLST